MRSVSIELLGTFHTVRSRSPEWIDFVRQLWNPLVVEDSSVGGVEHEIEESPEGWRLLVDDVSELPRSSVWQVVNDLRQAIVERGLTRLRARGFVDLHAAVVARGETVALLVGRPAAGKTSLSLELAEQGWSVFSDDVAPLTPSGDVLPFPKPPLIRDVTSWTRWKDRWSPPRWVPEPDIGFLLPIDIFPLTKASRGRPSHTFFLNFSRAAPPAASALSSALAVSRAAEHVRNLDASTLGVLSAIVGSACSAVLTFGSYPEGASLLKEVVARGESL